jgi:hypothetical protein
MKIFPAFAIFALALVPLSTQPVEAASRTTCLCQGKESGRLHHRFACEYHFKKPGRWPASAPSTLASGCTRQEWVQFKTYLCVKGGQCTYEYVRSSSSKVPLDAQ